MYQDQPRTCLLIHRFLRRVRTVRSNHLLSLLAQGVPLHDLEILQAGQDLVLNLELDLHAILGSFLDGEGVRFEILHLARVAKVNDDVRTTFDLATVNVCSKELTRSNTSRPKD